MGDNFEKSKNGFVDYLLLDEKSNPLLVLEAKKSTVHPLDAKEQARNYALNLRAKYIILSNGDLHYFWNISKGNPEIITSFPTYESLVESKALNSSPLNLINALIDKYYIALSQEPGIENTSIWKSNDEIAENDYNLSVSTYVEQEDTRKVTTHRLWEMKQRGEKIAMLTSYDFSMAKLID